MHYLVSIFEKKEKEKRLLIINNLTKNITHSIHISATSKCTISLNNFRPNSYILQIVLFGFLLGESLCITAGQRVFWWRFFLIVLVIRP